jgi:hypothetical protein
MRILFDNGTPRGLSALLTGHTVEEARLHGWEELENGELIEAAVNAAEPGSYVEVEVPFRE